MTNPVIFNTTGVQPQSPASLNAQLLSNATAISPSLTSLPSSLIEDMASTGTGGLIVQDSAFVELVNSISPYTANPFILQQLGNVYGVQQGQGSNTSVYVVFTGLAGYVINKGFIVSDGTNQYTVQDGGTIGSGGTSAALYCLANNSGSWAVPANTVTTLITSVPTGYTLSVTNPNAGLAGSAAQTTAQYQAQVIQAGLATAQGTPAFLKTLLQNVAGVQSNLISIRQSGSSWETIVGGGDPYQVAGAIFSGVFNINNLTGSSVNSSRNQNISIVDYPDTYNIVYVVPVNQTVTMVIDWNTSAGTNYVSNATISQLVQAPILAYINSIYVGQPISLIELQQIFTSAVSSVIQPQFFTHINFIVSINSTVVTPPTGSSLISGDTEGYFTMVASGLTVNQT